MYDKVLEVAYRVEAGEVDRHAAQVAIDAYKWRAAKLVKRGSWNFSPVGGSASTIDRKLAGRVVT
jgi:hypothetical protein